MTWGKDMCRFFPLLFIAKINRSEMISSSSSFSATSPNIDRCVEEQKRNDFCKRQRTVKHVKRKKAHGCALLDWLPSLVFVC